MIKKRYYQIEAEREVFNYFRKNKTGNPLVAIPTGAGKTIVISSIINTAVTKWNVNVLILSHRKELLVQNYNTLIKLIDESLHEKVGIYSAGLDSKTVGKITIAGIQSVRDKAHLFSNVKLIVIDEAHLISTRADTSYRKFLNNMQQARVVGFTATPYRLGTGLIVGSDHIFNKIVYDITSKEKFNKLIEEGFLTKLISKRTQIELDAEMAGIATQSGDYKESDMDIAFNVEKITNLVVKELIDYGKEYKKWLVFAINISHAESIAETLTKQGISSIAVHSKMELDRDKVLKAYTKGKIKCLVNVNILTVGIDVPSIDLIALLRPTKSASLYVQAVGRGLRVAPEKDHCLVLDYAKNVQTLGPVNDVQIKRKRKTKGGEPVTKTCPKCNTLHHPFVKVCDVCGHKFKIRHSLTSRSSDRDILDYSREVWYDVQFINYSRHKKTNSPDSLKVTYICGTKTFSEWVCIEHYGYAGILANRWLSQRYNGDVPTSIDEVLSLSDKIAKPSRILVKEGGKYPQILEYDIK